MYSLIVFLMVLLGMPVSSMADTITQTPAITRVKPGPTIKYNVETIPLERAGVNLHLQRLTVAGDNPERQILLVHGLTYSSHEFDVDVEDYSLARFLSRQGFAVWTLDVAGYGQSEEVKDGFTPDSEYAAEDIAAAAEKILALSGQKKLDVLGWSWGTVTAGLFAAKHPEMIHKLVLYAPILTGLGAADVKNAFNHNTWIHAAGDFQTKADGSIDNDIVTPEVVNAFQSNCWKYDKDYSPNGGRRDLLQNAEKILIAFDKVKIPTLVIGGDKDPYLNFAALDKETPKLPQGSQYVKIPGAAHAMMMEKPYYQQFRETVLKFLE